MRSLKPKQQPIISKPVNPFSHLPDPSEYTDCETCRHYKSWKYNLVDCSFSVVPQQNCLIRKIKCVKYEI